MQKVYRLIETAGPSLTTILITGETGTGKELAARALHDCSKRSASNFLKVDCTALPETLMESELFGYKKGAFTDARFNKPGKFELADQGTIFLDEIGELPVTIQAKFLRVLEERAFEPLGATSSVRVDVRIITATNRDLKQAVEREFFRKDLYYRLNMFPIDLPPLRERLDDIPLLADHFLRRAVADRSGRISGIAATVMELFMRLSWPGNVRQLKHAIEYAVITCPAGKIEASHLPRDLLEDRPAELPAGSTDVTSFADIDRKMVIDSLTRNRLNVSKTAADLGISRTTLWRKLRRYNIKY